MNVSFFGARRVLKEKDSLISITTPSLAHFNDHLIIINFRILEVNVMLDILGNLPII